MAIIQRTPKKRRRTTSEDGQFLVARRRTWGEHEEAKGRDLGRTEWENVRLAARELGARLKLSAAPSTGPSDCCRRIRKRKKEQTTLGSWCFLSIWWKSSLCFRAMYIVWNEKIFFGWKLCEWVGQEMHLVSSVLLSCGSKAKTSLVSQCVYVSVSRQSICWGMIKGLNFEEED